MNNNEKRTFWLSVFAALFAVFLLYSYTQEKTDELTRKFGAKERVVVASREIKEMETIDETMLQIVERPIDFIEPSAVADPELAVGLVALAPIKKNEQILETKIMEPGPITGLALQVAPGKRAVTIPVDEVRGVSKLIKPGDRIDIVAALDVGKGQNQRRELKIINELPRLYEKEGKNEFIRNIRADTSFTNITIEASPKQAQDLIYILSTSPGSLFLTLRHPSDHLKKLRTLPTANAQSILGRPTASTISNQLSRRRPAALPKLPAKKKRARRKKKRSGPYIDL